MSSFEELSLATVIGKNNKSFFAEIVSQFSLKKNFKVICGSEYDSELKE